MRRHEMTVEVRGPWSLATSKAFWEGFSPNALPAAGEEGLRSVFRVDRDWSRAEVEVTQRDAEARVVVTGDGGPRRRRGSGVPFPVVGHRRPRLARRRPSRPVIADAQARLPGLRPCGFPSPYEAAAWSVLSQRVRIAAAARLGADLVRRHGDDGAFPAPGVLRGLDLDLPGRKAEYLHAVAEAALDGRLDGAALRAVDPEQAVAAVQDVKGLGPFAAELVVLRGANAPDALPQQERRLLAEVLERYGRPIAEVAEAWRPFRTWAAVHLRALRERRTHEIGG